MITKTFNYAELFEDQPDGSSILSLPPELCEKYGFYPGDTVIITVEDGKLYIKKKYGEE